MLSRLLAIPFTIFHLFGKVYSIRFLLFFLFKLGLHVFEFIKYFSTSIELTRIILYLISPHVMAINALKTFHPS